MKDTEIKEIINQINESIEKPFVTPQFGDNWKEYAKKHQDIDTVINIAWRQGRKAILLERALIETLSGINKTT